MDSIADRKRALRAEMRRKRRTVTSDERAHAAFTLAERLLADSAIIAARQQKLLLAVYLATPDELDLTPFLTSLLAEGVPLVAPRWNGKTYDLARLPSLDLGDLQEGPMHVREPRLAEIVSPSEIAVWIVPGLAFTRVGGRLGYGGGWYDRLLASRATDSTLLGVAYSFQFVASLPLEAHDLALTRVICAN